MNQCWWFLSLLVFVRAVSHLEQQWHSWKERHGKLYMDIEEEHQRRNIWLDNLDKIEKFNNGATGNFSLAINQFADLVKNQGSHCKQSSWAFSAVAAIEGQYYRETGQLVTLSEQQLIDCTTGFGNAGCHGGRMINSFKYAIKNGGLCQESDYDYLGYKWHCMSEYCSSVAHCVDYTRVKIGSEVALLDAIYRAGPVSVGVDATNYHFQFYSDGVYAESGCNSHSLNHGMLLVGYGVTWGTSWGDRGYMKIARNMNNMCGVATAASYPTVKQSD
ncbi:Cathepsin L2 [Geodia barretti]|uniref:Cathepsin L2 n=1 Tax=Geodia barretti TaxID=519541 RepID=A0AA35R8U0_GEOBA|nr:Cathepsin L2 [Geodia barretti]